MEGAHLRNRLIPTVSWQSCLLELKLCPMVHSEPLRVALGRYDPWRRTASIEIRDNRIKFVPGKGTYGEFEATESAFPSGTRLEYRVEMGDMFFDGDNSQALGRTLWAVQPNGSRKLLASDFILYINYLVAARNLRKCGIPFRAMRFYKGPDGKEIEYEIDTSPSVLHFPSRLLVGSSHLWLGIIAGLLISRLSYIVAIGAVGFMGFAIAGWRSTASSRTAFVTALSSFPIYSATYAFAVVIARFVLKR
jgi:hypothetical protein